jgi:hypothetical protein
MNYVDFEKTIKKLLIYPDTYKTKSGKDASQYCKGIYIISRHKDDLTYKIGVAYGKGGLRNRVHSYKLCYPYSDEFYVHYLIIGTTDVDSRILEDVILKDTSLKNTIENPTAEGRKSKEYKMVASADQLKAALTTALQTNLNLWTHAFTFGKQGWNRIIQTDKITLKKPHHASIKRPGVWDKLDISNLDFIVNMDRAWNVGDNMDTPWGLGTVKKMYKNGDLDMSFTGYAGAYRIDMHK